MNSVNTVIIICAAKSTFASRYDSAPLYNLQLCDYIRLLTFVEALSLD